MSALPHPRPAAGDDSPSAPGAAAQPAGISDVEVRGFRSAREVSFSPRALCALVGEANSGKSNLLAAIRAALDPASAPLTVSDAAADGDGTVSIRIRLADGGTVSLHGSPENHTVEHAPGRQPILFMPASARASRLLVEGDASSGEAARALEIFQSAAARGGPVSPAIAAVEALEACCGSGVRGLLLLVEEPELYLRPHAQRYLYRLLRRFASAGNQVIYSTHSPAFLSVVRLEELVFVERLPEAGTRTAQPRLLTPEEDFRVLTEFDAARGEIFLARAVVLAEGQTEKLVLPFVFSALGYDPDREAISIVECGGKPNIPLFARICRAVGVPFVVVHDTDRKASGRVAPAEQALNALIADTAGDERVVVLDPDFEAVAGLAGNRHKPERAWRDFGERAVGEMPAQLVRAAELALSFVRPYAEAR